ncbi:hypothetical protein SAY87_017207 [Trapa incisa]|uniref:J domain-containing protein n=1 Tax=Trapa incisa TaxID=236973 RepID=A0AAN7LI59_9MYRT|nr:hypothetical protein SAY87_017207 [Trapa incisa]
MENLSHSFRRQNKHSRKSSHVNAASKGVYDDVFGGPPKFGVPKTLSPRSEDYREIFGGFHAPRVSSIPVLDLPVLDEQEMCFDARSPGFDYSEVFGGLHCLDFVDACGEVFGQHRGGSIDCGASDEAWTPSVSESLSEGSDHSGNNQCRSKGDSHHSFNGDIEYNVSYHRTNPRRTAEITDGLRCAAEIHAVPGYSYMVDHINPYQVEEKHLKKNKSDNSNVRNDARLHKNYGRLYSCPGETFVTISDISLRTKPMQFPPPSKPPAAAETVDPNGPISSWKTGYIEGNQENHSTSLPPFFDMEVDASSSAAALASAAAMEEAMVKAQAQLKSAKQMMEKKKESRKNNARIGANGEWKDMGENHLDGVVQGKYRGKSSEIKISFMEEPQDVMGTKCAVQDSLEGKKLQNYWPKLYADVQGRGSEYSEVFSRTEEVGQWKEATQFFELVRPERSRAVLVQMDKEKYLPEDVRTPDNGEIKGTIGRFEQEENFDMMKGTVTKRAPREDCVSDAKDVIANEAKVSNTEENATGKKKACQHIIHPEEAKKTHRDMHHDRETARNPNGSASAEDHECMDVPIELAPEIEVEQLMDRKKDGLKLKSSFRTLESEENIGEGCGKACNEKITEDASKREVKEKRPALVIELMGNEKRVPQLYREVEYEDKGRMNLESEWKEANERDVSERKLKEMIELKETEKIMKEIHEQEVKKKFNEACDQEGNDKKMENCELTENQRKQEASVREEQERRPKETPDGEETEKRFREVLKQTETETLKETPEKVENDKKQIEPCKQEEEGQGRKESTDKDAINMLKIASQLEGNEIRLDETCEKEQMDKKLEVAEEIVDKTRRLGEDFSGGQTEMRTLEARGRRKSGNSFQEPCQDEDDVKNLNDSCMDGSAGIRDERDIDSKEADDATMDTFEFEELDKWLNEIVDMEEPDDLNNADKKIEECIQNDTKSTSSDFPALAVEQVLGESRDSVDASNDGGLIKAEFKGSKNKISANEQEGSKTEDSMSSPLVDQPKLTNLEGPEVFSEMSSVSSQQDENNSAQRWRKEKENINKSEVNFGGGGDRVKTSRGDVLNTCGTSQHLQVDNQVEGWEDSLNGSVNVQEKEIERLRREREMEKDRFRKIEEEREREREREKDRMAVDRATLETREKSERAAVERAIAKAQQRTLAEARERLEKACAKAKEQSFIEKTSMAAKVRAERAAVERATAEARERAASRYNELRQNDLTSDLCESKHQNAGSSSSKGCQYSSGSGAPLDKEKPEGVEGESAQRCRARLERHKRTAERAAKALAEKNMRDLLVQKEQAERSRLAETLDADVKRWSSGKEGNLRALLSTLQYILGPDSGWQPIPLTEVITSPAVKKAYRKATLCVHPDKLQQRGASIQQRYICEKVFDLLKEAWNRFNSEER